MTDAMKGRVDRGRPCPFSLYPARHWCVAESNFSGMGWWASQQPGCNDLKYEFKVEIAIKSVASSCRKLGYKRRESIRSLQWLLLVG